MKKIYDKLFLLIAVLALLAGVGLFFLNVSDKSPDTPVSATVASPIPYEAVPVTAMVLGDVEWPSPVEQSTEWVYDVFTPPKIYLDEDGQFSQVGWVPSGPEAPFGIYLADIVRNAFRIQLEGYVQEDRRDPLKSLLFFVDEERDEKVRLRPGDESDESGIKVLDFKVERDIDPETSVVTVTATATLLDTRSGEEISLVEGERLYEDAVTVRLQSREDAAFSIELNRAGQNFDGPVGNYELVEINLEEESITLEKAETDSEEAILRVLTVKDFSSEADAVTISPQPVDSTFPF